MCVSVYVCLSKWISEDTPSVGQTNLSLPLWLTHTHIHTYTYTHIHKYIHTYTHTQAHTNTHTHARQTDTLYTHIIIQSRHNRIYRVSRPYERMCSPTALYFLQWNGAKMMYHPVCGDLIAMCMCVCVMCVCDACVEVWCVSTMMCWSMMCEHAKYVCMRIRACVSVLVDVCVWQVCMSVCVCVWTCLCVRGRVWICVCLPWFVNAKQKWHKRQHLSSFAWGRIEHNSVLHTHIHTRTRIHI